MKLSLSFDAAQLVNFSYAFRKSWWHLWEANWVQDNKIERLIQHQRVENYHSNLTRIKLHVTTRNQQNTKLSHLKQSSVNLTKNACTGSSKQDTVKYHASENDNVKVKQIMIPNKH